MMISTYFSSKDLSPQDDTLDLLQNNFEDVPQLLERLLRRKNISCEFAQIARDVLDLNQ